MSDPAAIRPTVHNSRIGVALDPVSGSCGGTGAAAGAAAMSVAPTSGVNEPPCTKCATPVTNSGNRTGIGNGIRSSRSGGRSRRGTVDHHFLGMQIDREQIFSVEGNLEFTEGLFTDHIK